MGWVLEVFFRFFLSSVPEQYIFLKKTEEKQEKNRRQNHNIFLKKNCLLIMFKTCLCFLIFLKIWSIQFSVYKFVYISLLCEHFRECFRGFVAPYSHSRKRIDKKHFEGDLFILLSLEHPGLKHTQLCVTDLAMQWNKVTVNFKNSVWHTAPAPKQICPLLRTETLVFKVIKI